MIWVFLIIAAYLLGSVPFGLVLATARGVDLRSVGSGNIGATNVARALGRNWGCLCFALDCLKGLVPMLVAMHFVEEVTVGSLWLWFGVGYAAVLGHVFPLYLKFKGGKGVSTSLGAVVGLYPYMTVAGLITFAIWGACLLIWRYVSLASIVAAVVFPIILTAAVVVLPDWSFSVLWPLLVIAMGLTVLVLIRHVGNIKRLLAGSERKIFQK
ncbi:MAG: glycerol-3-phosphate 1-O-acyltransferase PlsY [Planctomycetes bacterium]|nr:glycerol-3-phosphate 1-O-acyltransferase PlsY [Planctomycetota bacterium]